MRDTQLLRFRLVSSGKAVAQVLGTDARRSWCRVLRVRTHVTKLTLMSISLYLAANVALADQIADEIRDAQQAFATKFPEFVKETKWTLGDGTVVTGKVTYTRPAWVRLQRFQNLVVVDGPASPEDLDLQLRNKQVPRRQYQKLDKSDKALIDNLVAVRGGDSVIKWISKQPDHMAEFIYGVVDIETNDKRTLALPFNVFKDEDQKRLKEICSFVLKLKAELTRVKLQRVEISEWHNEIVGEYLDLDF